MSDVWFIGDTHFVSHRNIIPCAKPRKTLREQVYDYLYFNDEKE